MGLNSEASAALVYLILYAILFAFMLYGYATGHLRFRSRYTVVLFHVTVRLASQATGLAFGLVGYANTSLLVAYFILGAEGYFTLVLCTYRFLISWHNHNLASHDSWLEPRFPPGTPAFKRFLLSFALFGPTRRPMAVMHNLLIGANAIIITGGNMVGGGSDSVEDFRTNPNLLTSKILRTVGQSIFLSINVFLLYCILDTIRQSRSENPRKRTHPTLLILLAIWPCLFVRGMYGVLSGVLPAFNYYNPDNYEATGLKNSFIVSEYIMGTTMEWVSCTMLMVTYLTSRNDPKKADFEAEKGDKIPLDAGA
ncbi:hypothetical protein M413DRAFT_448197 [Hebeloma cylindrosporum]|uniref:Uncharacterized protein n=1 Tax=Hebeloma cylindrosporum TaxID=76867 RepID=A0A0C3BML9_HEBCY|nr:hypothetical protein M413DRAFT_448197 [Hebeloma cylindrosporum h7]